MEINNISLNRLKLDKCHGLEIRGRWRAAIEGYTQMVSILDEQNPMYAEILNGRGIVKRMLGSFEPALSDFMLAGKKAQDDAQKAAAMINIADLNRVGYADYVSAHGHLDDAKEIISEREFLLHARLANQRGLIYRAENDIEKALTAHMSARDYSVKLLTQESDLKPEDSKNYNMMKIYAMACQNMVGDSLLGELFLDLEHVAKEAMDAFSLIGDKQGMVNCLLNKGHIYRRRKDKLAAIDSFERASEFADDIDGNERTKTIVNLNLAILCLQQKDDTLATYNLNRLVIGVATETLSRHDKNSVLPLFDELKKLYSDSSLKIKDFERISAVF